MRSGNRAAAVPFACLAVLPLLLGVACGHAASSTALPLPAGTAASALAASPEPATTTPLLATPIPPASPSSSPIATPRPAPTFPASAALPDSIEAIAAAAKLVQGTNGQAAHLLGAALLWLQDELAQEAAASIRRLPPASPDTPV